MSLFFLQDISIFLLFCEASSLFFFRRTKIIAWRYSIKTVSWAPPKIHHKTPVLESFLPVKVAGYRSSPPEVFLVKGVLKMCNKFTGEYPWQSVISIKLQSNFIEITVWHGCSPVYLLRIIRTPFSQNTSKRLLLRIETCL